MSLLETYCKLRNILCKCFKAHVCFALFLSTGCLPSTVEQPKDVALWIDGEPVKIDYLKNRVSVKVQTWGIIAELEERDLARITDLVIDELVKERVIRKKALELNLDAGVDVKLEEDYPVMSFPEGFEMLENAERQWWDRVVSNMELLTYSDQISSYLSQNLIVTDDDIKMAYEDRMDFYTFPSVYEYQVIRVNDAELATDIHRQLRQRASFESLAKKHSNIRGEGALGEIATGAIGEFPVEIEPELADIAEGRISPVLRAQDGYYIYRILKKHDSYVKPFEEVRDSLYKELKMIQRTRIFQRWLDRETRKVSIRYGTPLPHGGM